MAEEPEDPYGWLWGYARVSTEDQDLTLQREALARFGVPEKRIIAEHASGKSMKRKALRRLLDKYIREGDTIVIWKLDRLGRTLRGVLDAIEEIQKQGVNVVSLTEKIDTTSAMGKAFLQMALVFAELERNLISERTKAGMAARKAAGARFGRQHMIAENRKRLAYARRLDREGRLRDEHGLLLMSADELREGFNRADPKSPIKSPETVRRWVRGDKARGLVPFAGLEVEAEDDIPLAETEADDE